jgi:hypothetical protein
MEAEADNKGGGVSSQPRTEVWLTRSSISGQELSEAISEEKPAKG